MTTLMQQCVDKVDQAAQKTQRKPRSTVSTFMSIKLARVDLPVADGAFQVLRPRPEDAIGATLRDTFGQYATLPDDWHCLLHRIDRAERAVARR